MKYRKIEYKIPFNKPYFTPNELKYIKNAYTLGQLSGNGFYTKKCHQWVEEKIGCQKVLLTQSGTSALEMLAILAKIKPGDEIIMPSFTFVTTASAFVLRGGIPVFVDIRPDTLNINENLMEEAITPRTKAIMVVHYAGVGCEMDKIREIAKKHKILVLEDAAQAFLAKYKGKYLGTFGNLAAVSFHETKNIISGEGGAILINDIKFVEPSEIVWEKGTNRNKFLRGEIDKYTWVDVGSSYLPSEAIAAFLYAQLEKSSQIISRRIKIWNKYHKELLSLEKDGFIRRPIVPKDCLHNGHIYYILLKNIDVRTRLINFLKKKGILSVFHYIPLHSSPAGKKYCRYVGKMNVTDRVSETLLRLPLFYEITDKEIEYIVDSIKSFFK